MVNIILNDNPCEAEEGATIISAATAEEIYIPTLCHHPDLPPFKDLPLASRIFRGDNVYENEPVPEEQLHRADNPQSAIRNPQLEGCGLCVVEVAGLPEPVRACQTVVAPGMSIQTESEALKELRRTNLMVILSRHPHACLTCAQREGCSLEDCSSNVPKEEHAVLSFITASCARWLSMWV